MVPDEARALRELGITRLPGDWQLSTVGDAYKISNSMRFPLSIDQRKEMQGGYPYYGPTGCLDNINEYRVEGRFALIGEDGDHFIAHNTKPQTQIVSGKFNVNNHAHIVADGAKASIDWFFYSFFSRRLVPHLTRQGAGRYKLNKGALEKIPVLLPPLPEQRKIADILSTWDQAIEMAEALLRNARTQKRALMQQLLTGKRRFPAFEGQPWKEVRLGDVSTSWSGGTPSRKKPEFYGGNIPWIKSGEVNASRVTATSETITEIALKQSSARMVKRGNILVAMYGATAGVVSIAGIDAAINQAILAVDPQEGIENSFLHRSIEFAMETTKRLTQGGQPNLNAAIIRATKIFLPEADEQRLIATAIEDSQNQIEGLFEQVAQLRTEKKALMQQLLTGKRRVVA